MTVHKRIQNGIFAAGQLALVMILLLFPGRGLTLITACIQIFLAVAGVQYIVYYFTMARYMVNGKAMLYSGLLYLNFCIFIGFMNVTPSAYIMLYLIGYFLLRSVLRSFHLLAHWRLKDRQWFSAAVSAALYFGLAVFGLFHLRDETVMVYLFCVDVALSAVQRITRVIKKTAIVYIP